MSFFSAVWDVLLWALLFTVFIGYLMALFSIITDLFRDTKLNGWLKALWFVFLIFLPLLTALAYLIFRGRGMTERAVAQQQAAQAAADDYIRSVAGSPTDDIAKAKSLLDSGAITQAEYEQLKAAALAR
ncbi:SHOCT domain-containing protein [Microbacterium sp. NIBRBAC000506063]|uniref:SHOCT domain-containing protein n=1 Tax=Microbacterium sp. NIBRBAC000506063 TaxID=2734618 RepID=UPI001BB4EBFB|nr:SHOCT domain-containing protein [Microbacterium sp. NIBRBAC000506063]QTV79272.1 SHOCT domain-containing protein [Microbacterium sp. NIBRBAC000506063]